MSDESKQHQHPFEIFVNAQKKTWNEEKINFTQVVDLAFPPPHHPGQMFTVQYSHGPEKNPQGTLAEGQSVYVKSGMVFNVHRTDKS